MDALGACGVGATPAIPTNVFGDNVAASVSEQIRPVRVSARSRSLLQRCSFPSSSIVERLTVNQVVAGANPAMGAIFSLAAKNAEITAKEAVYSHSLCLLRSLRLIQTSLGTEFPAHHGIGHPRRTHIPYPRKEVLNPHLELC